MKRIVYLISIAFSVIVFNADGSNPSINYLFEIKSGTSDSIKDATGNGYNAKLIGTASVKKIGRFSVLQTGATNGYVDMGAKTGQIISKLKDFTISTYLYVDPSRNLVTPGNFVWSFSNSSDIATNAYGCLFYTAKDSRYAICSTNYKAERSVSQATAFTKGEWIHVAYTQSDSTGSVYINGVLKKTSTVKLLPDSVALYAIKSGIEPFKYNYLGKSSYASDNLLLNSMYSDFRIYNESLTAIQISALAVDKAALDTATYTDIVQTAAATISLGDISAVKSDLTLPLSIPNGPTLSWKSSNTSLISNSGVVTRPSASSGAATVVLTATVKKGFVSMTKSFNVTVLPWSYTDEQSVQIASDSLQLTGNLSNLRSSLVLPATGLQGTTIIWKSDNNTIISDGGVVLAHPEKGTGKVKVTLTATITKGNTIQTKTFDVYVAEKEGFDAYLFVYFTGNTNNSTTNQEAIRFGLSNDGKNYLALNSNNYIIASDTISQTGGVRDPHILRGEDGKTFYMVVTDMKASLGWDSNRGIILMKSTDLIHWSHSAINVATTYPGFASATRVWAPQTIYDKQAGKYMVYFTVKLSGGVDKVYYAYANADFTALESEPKLLFSHPGGFSTIDADIIEKESKYYLFTKCTEPSGNGIKKSVADNVAGPYALIDKVLDQTTQEVEGSCVFRLTDSDNYILMYDIFANGKYQFTKSSDLTNFTIIDSQTSMNFAPRHGTTIAITQEEAERLTANWGAASDIYIDSSASDSIRPINSSFDQTAKTIYLAARRGVDITNFDPQLKGAAGLVITPKGKQDFSKGAINYTVSIPGVDTLSYSVSAEVNGNPVIEGYYADPEILYSNKTHKFYMYPTSDGFAGWGGYYFKVFSSPDLVNWTDEGVIIDMHDSNQITWANSNAWAPCIVEKMIDGEYKYVFYFSGGLNGGAKQLGYAVSDNPTGPFVVSASPLITSSPAGKGQQIDSDVFTDPVSGKTYLYWGNGYMAVAELNDNLTFLKTTPVVITPTNYTEGTYVFYRKGKYYFTWSKGNTSNADYKVYYGYSTSPTGPISTPANNNILVKDLVKGIDGPGHNSIIQIPGKDEWYMVYHRISRPNGIYNTHPGPGNVRELCIDKLEFNSDGTIKKVVTTIKGISPVKIDGGVSAVEPVYNSQEKGELVSTELYSINGVKLNINQSIPVGVYILKKNYKSGSAVFEKTMIVSQNQKNLIKQLAKI